MSITTILTNIVTVFASIEQVNTPQDKHVTHLFLMILVWWNKKCKEGQEISRGNMVQIAVLEVTVAVE